MSQPPVKAHVSRCPLGFVPYLYLLRVQTVAALVLVGLPAIALYPEPSPLLHGLFDINYADVTQSAIALCLISLSASAASWTLLLTSWSTIVNARDRFGTLAVSRVRFPIEWQARAAFAVTALPVIFGAVYHSRQASGVAPAALVGGAVVGCLVALAMFLFAIRTADWLQRAVEGPKPRGLAGLIRRFVRWLATKENIREGYIDLCTGNLRPGHLLAGLVFTLSFLLYVGVGIGKFVQIGYSPLVPTLASLLLLLLMLCWGAAGLAFFFDRYRVPVLVPLLALPLITAWLPWSDHFYRTIPRQVTSSPTPAEVLALKDGPVIIIATNGGGIQAAAWTARVLVGLEQTLRPEFGELFGRSIRMVSGVSGGGVGAMYFLNQYSEGRLPDATELDKVIKVTEASSLDDIAWGAAYADWLRTLFPLPLRSLQFDRGQALEWAWTRDSGLTHTLGDWRGDVWARRRPASIFNATIVDSGERLLIGTTRLAPGLGRRNFEDLYRQVDVQIVTASRLSASFTYVSPAARADLPGPQFHVVDGGYYDNYGMSTLIEWLQEALIDTEAVKRPNRVLVIQIRGVAPGGDNTPKNTRGWFYQAWAPIQAILTVRSTGQLSHNEQEFERMQQLWRAEGITIDSATFTFRGDRPPLSWHLTGREKVAISDEWKREQTSGSSIGVVRAFLRGQPVPHH